LEEEGLNALLDEYYSPQSKTDDARLIAIHAYSSLLLLPPNQYSARMLAKLTTLHPMDELHAFIFQDEGGGEDEKVGLWEGLVKAIFACPGKVTNALSDKVPVELEDR
jgi:telomere length regulation protein